MQPPFDLTGKATLEDPHRRQKQAWEYKLINGLLAVWRKHQETVLEFLKKHRDVKKQTKAIGDDLVGNEKLWEAIRQDHIQLLLPVFEQIMMEAAVIAIEGLPFSIGINWELVNQAAATWAKKYTFDLVTGIDKTTQGALQTALNNWITAGEDFPALIARVQLVFSNPIRAEMIAVTEATRAYATANVMAWKESGVVDGYIFNTAFDDIVCPLCLPLNGQVFPLKDQEHLPPLHVRCRCWTATHVMET